MRHRNRSLAVCLLTAALSSTALVGTSTASPIDGGPSHTIFVVKDLGGGGYYNATNATFYVAATGTTALIDAAATGADLLATSADDGRTLLLLVNRAVLVPVQKLL